MTNLKNYKYVIAGFKGAEKYHKQMEPLFNDPSIKVYYDLSDKERWELFAKSKMFLHAKGYGINENKFPEGLEHFGLVTVEAMNYGAIPIVVNKGGQREIVVNGKDGYLFNTKEDLIKAIKQLGNNDVFRKKIELAARKSAKKFMVDRVLRKINKIIEPFD